MKLLITRSVMRATRCSLSFLSENKYLLLTFLLTTAANFLFSFTYPINVALYDNPNYLQMMHGRVSNLMHASGYPALLMVLLGIFDVPRGSTIFDIAWLDKIQLLQVLLHSGLMLSCILICAKVFNKLSASIMCLVWGLSVLFMAGVNSSAPEWLQGELVALSLMLSARAFICTSNKTKIMFYVFSWFILAFAYLVKYNSLIFFPILALIIAFDKKSVYWKVFAVSMAILPCFILILGYVEFFHYPTTKSRQLTYDHAWVLVASIPEAYFALPSEQLEINSLRWKALSSIVPADYSMMNAYCCIDVGAPPDVRDAYYIKYRQIMRLSRNELIKFLKLNPLPSGFIQWSSAVPLYWYVGFPETDALGIATFNESLRAIPSVYLLKIFRGLKTWSAFGKQPVPFYSNQLGLTFVESINDKNGFIRATPDVHTNPAFHLYWNPKEIVWSPGVRVFEFLASAIMPRWLELLILAGSTLGVLFSTNSRIRLFGLLYLGSMLMFSTAAFVLMGMRHKEFFSIIPLTAIFYGIGLSSVYCILREALSSKTGRVRAIGWSDAGTSFESGCHLPQRHAVGRVGLDAAQTLTVAPSPDLQTPSDAASTTDDPVPAAVSSSGGRAKGPGLLRRFFWLDDRVAKAVANGFSTTNAGWSEFELGRQARAGIAQIGETGEGNAAVLLLERAEVLFLLRSHLARRNLAPVGMSLNEDDWARVRQVPAFAAAWAELSGAQQSALQTGLGSQAELALVDVDVEHRRYLASALRILASALSKPLEREASMAGRVLFMRWTRIGATAVVLLAIAWSISGAMQKKFARPNIAFGRPVTVSSQYTNVALDHTLLVDGDKTDLGFHTEAGPNQWVMIDLGSTKNISKVVVYNRVDCCQARAVPLRLEVSDDGINFRKVVDRTEDFDVWTAKGLDAEGRYVRLRHLGSNFLHFAEVEVY